MSAHTHPPPHPPHSPAGAWVGKAGHTAQEVPVSGRGEETLWLWPGWPTAGDRSQFPSFDNPYKARGGGGKGSARGPAAGTPRWHGWGVTRRSAPPPGRVWSPRITARAAPQAGAGPGWHVWASRCPVGALGPKRTLLPLCGRPGVRAQARRDSGGRQSPGWGCCGAERLRVGAEVGVWAQAALPEVPCSELGPGPSPALPGVALRCSTALTLRENVNFGTFLPEGLMQGVKGTARLRRELIPACLAASPRGEVLPAPSQSVESKAGARSPRRSPPPRAGRWCPPTPPVAQVLGALGTRGNQFKPPLV